MLLELGLLLVAAGVAAAAWSLWLLRRRRVPRWLRFLPPAALIGTISAALYTVLRVRDAFHTAAGADASRKASLLAERISAALNGLAVGLAFVGAVLVLLAYFTVTAPRRSLPELPAARAHDARVNERRR